MRRGGRRTGSDAAGGLYAKRVCQGPDFDFMKTIGLICSDIADDYMA